jgi:hypothetical protein
MDIPSTTTTTYSSVDDDLFMSSIGDFSINLGDSPRKTLTTSLSSISYNASYSSSMLSQSGSSLCLSRWESSAAPPFLTGGTAASQQQKGGAIVPLMRFKQEMPRRRLPLRAASEQSGQSFHTFASWSSLRRRLPSFSEQSGQSKHTFASSRHDDSSHEENLEDSIASLGSSAPTLVTHLNQISLEDSTSSSCSSVPTVVALSSDISNIVKGGERDVSKRRHSIGETSTASSLPHNDNQRPEEQPPASTPTTPLSKVTEEVEEDFNQNHQHHNSCSKIEDDCPSILLRNSSLSSSLAPPRLPSRMQSPRKSRAPPRLPSRLPSPRKFPM